MTATELEVFNSIYLRIDNEQKGIVDITEINDVSGTYQGHDYVDLGLPSGTLWATMNVGAKKPQECGDCFGWGETSPHMIYFWDYYKYCKGSESTLTRYCMNSSDGIVDGKTELDSGDDVATAKWGNGWQMPDVYQLNELLNVNNISLRIASLAGVEGTLIISKSNGKKMFLPWGGGFIGLAGIGAGLTGEYWSRSLNTNNSNEAYSLSVYDAKSSRTESNRRYEGLCVRPVRISNSKER